VTNEGEEGSLTLKQDGKILARPQQPGSNITKEHGRRPGPDAQEIRPSTRARSPACAKHQVTTPAKPPSRSPGHQH
jgi:hypothetical protein